MPGASVPFMTTRREQVQHINKGDLERITKLLREVGGPSVAWGAQSVLDVWLAEARMESDRQAARRVLVATWALVAATGALVVATVGLITVS